MINSSSAVRYSIDASATRRDLAIGLAFSLTCLAGLFWVSDLLKSGPPKALPREVPTSVQMIMPKNEPDEQPVEDVQPQLMTAEIAPPMLTDVPHIARPDAFALKPEVAPPAGAAIDRHALTVSAGIGGVRGQPIFNPSMLDQQPVATYQSSPVFPYDMKKSRTTGAVVVDFILEADGHVSSAYAASSSQHAFEESAIQAVMKWKFRPGRRGGHAVRTHMAVPINFGLEHQ